VTTTPQWQPPAGTAAPQPTATRPWYRKKRIMIPAGLLVLAGIGGALSDPAETAQPAAAPASSSAPAATSAQPSPAPTPAPCPTG